MSVLLFLQVWLMWTDKTKEKQEKSIRQLAQEARQGNAHDENVLTYYRYQHQQSFTLNLLKIPASFGKVNRKRTDGACLPLWTSGIS